MKTFAFLLAFLGSALAFAPAVMMHSRTATTARNMVDLAIGTMSFDRVCREWRCKYEGDKTTSESLEAISKVLDEYLPAIKKVSPDIKVNRLVCGGCLGTYDKKGRPWCLTMRKVLSLSLTHYLSTMFIDFKLMMTVPLADFGPWEEKGFAPEADFLAKIKAIDGVSMVETQTITNMEI